MLEHLQFMVGQNHNLVGHLIISHIFPFEQNVQCVFHLVGQFLILIGHWLMSNHYFKACWSAVFSFFLLRFLVCYQAFCSLVFSLSRFSFSQPASNCKYSINYFSCCFICFKIDQPVYWRYSKNLVNKVFFQYCFNQLNWSSIRGGLIWWLLCIKCSYIQILTNWELFH